MDFNNSYYFTISIQKNQPVSFWNLYHKPIEVHGIAVQLCHYGTIVLGPQLGALNLKIKSSLML